MLRGNGNNIVKVNLVLCKCHTLWTARIHISGRARHITFATSQVIISLYGPHAGCTSIGLNCGIANNDKNLGCVGQNVVKGVGMGKWMDAVPQGSAHGCKGVSRWLLVGLVRNLSELV